MLLEFRAGKQLREEVIKLGLTRILRIVGHVVDRREIGQILACEETHVIFGATLTKDYTLSRISRLLEPKLQDSVRTPKQIRIHVQACHEIVVRKESLVHLHDGIIEAR